MQIYLKNMPKTDNIDSQWIKEFQRGNVEAFNHLIKRYKQPLIPFAHRFLGNRDDAVYCYLHLETGLMKRLLKLFRLA